MSDRKLPRGRPKGSGIDDRAKLRELSTLIAANPELRPTTAIKSVGITDPSAIRRLRDKYNAARTTPTHSEPSAAAPGARRHVAAATTTPTRRSRPVGPKMPNAMALASATTSPPPSGRDDALAPFIGLLSLSLRAAATALEHQVTLSTQVTRIPEIAALLRRQVEISAAMMALASPMPERSRRHH
jgi:hypothetical protein